MKIYFPYFLIVFMIFNCVSCYSQTSNDSASESHKLSEKVVLVNKNKSKITSVINTENSKYIAVFRDDKGDVEITEGRYKGLKTENAQTGLLFSNGHRIVFPKQETFLTNINEFIYTIFKNHLDDSKRIVKYKVANNSLVKIREKILDSNFSTIQSFASQKHFVISDYYELYGTHFAILDENLDSVFSYQPFNVSFSNYSIAIDNNYLFAAFASESSDEIKNKVLIVNLNSLKIESESEMFTTSFITQYAYASGESFVIKSLDNKLLCFDKHSNLKWVLTEITLAPRLGANSIAIDKLNNLLYIPLFTNEIIAVDLENGVIQWRRNLQNLLTNFISDGLAITDMNFSSKLNALGILLSKVKTHSTKQTTFENGRCITFDSNGVLKSNESISAKSNHKYEFVKGTNELFLSTDSKLFKYERN